MRGHGSEPGSTERAGPSQRAGPAPGSPGKPAATHPGEPGGPPGSSTPRTAQTGPVQPTGEARVALRPVAGAEITGGFWHARRAVNASVSIPEGAGQLETAGNLHNLRLAAGTADGGYRGDLPFLDSDVHKWLEASAWQLAGSPAELAARRDDMIALLAAAQQPDGYLQSYFQVVRRDERFADLQWGHELYCAGHLIQAAVADARCTGRDGLLRIARRFADLIDASLGPGGADGVGGHPEIETALVELYRCTGERRYLELASHFIDQRGRGLLGDGRFGRDYWQDRVPLRDATAVAGHAVRQFYLLAGAADVYAETGDERLLAAVVRLWEDAAATRTYLTGGTGSHHTDESFGDPYELPPERAYCETCAAIASVMLSWRLLLITGEARYADLMERTLYNGVLPGVSPDGRGYLYVNPLQVRAGPAGPPGDPDDRDSERPRARPAAGGRDQSAGRKPWFRCACCPPNIMRLLASLQHYLAATSGDALWVCHYASGSLSSITAGQRVRADIVTGYPWQGRVTVTIAETDGAPWTLALRVPGWSAGARLAVNAEPADAQAVDGWVRLTRTWRTGDTVTLELTMTPRLTEGHPRADAVRGCVAIERGPLVYCLEQVDQPAGARLDDVAVDSGAALHDRERPGLLGDPGPLSDVVTVTADGHLRQPAEPDGDGAPAGPDGNRASADADGSGAAWWPYRAAGATSAGRWQPVTLTAVPYFAWANRGPGSMRVWIPSRGTR